MRRSDIFDSYAKIAEESGLIKSADESKELKKYKDDAYPRAGSDDISTIEALYGVKPDDSIEYKYNIMEAAHPKAVVVAPSYDKLNALFENNIERQNIMLNIVMKPTTGKNVTQGPKYAKKELLMQLIRIANDMDNKNVDELRVLADNCITQLKKKTADWQDWFDVAKETGSGAGTGAVIGGVAGGILGALFGEGIGFLPGAKAGALAGGMIGGLVASLARTAPTVRNVAENAKDTSDQINDIKEKIPSNNVEYKFLDAFQLNLNALATLSIKYNELLSNIQNKQEDENSNDAVEAKTITIQFLSQVDKVNKFVTAWNDKVARRVYDTYVQHAKLMNVVYNLISDDVEDVNQSIASLERAIDNFKKTINQAKTDIKATVTKQDTAPQNPVPKNEKSYTEKPYGNEEPAFNNMKYVDFAKELGHDPSEREKAFFQYLSNS